MPDPWYPNEQSPFRLEGPMTDLDSMSRAPVALVPIGRSEAVLRRATSSVTP